MLRLVKLSEACGGNLETGYLLQVRHPSPESWVIGVTEVVQRILSRHNYDLKPWQQPVLIGVMGLPCAGKTEISTLLAKRFPLARLSTDEIRIEQNLASGPAAHDVMRSVAAVLFSCKFSVVFDGIHLDQDHRNRLCKFARIHGAAFELIYAVANESVLTVRMREREASPLQTTIDRKMVIGPDHFDRIRHFLEAPTAGERAWTIDTSESENVEIQRGPLYHYLERLLGDSGRQFLK